MKSKETQPVVIRPGDRVQTSMGSFEYITRDGNFARCLECGCPAYAAGGFFHSREHVTGHTNYVRCVEAGTPGAILTYDGMRKGFESIRTRSGYFAKRARVGIADLNEDVSFQIELSDFLTSIYNVFYTSNFWGQSWNAKPVIPQGEYVRLLWNTPRFRAWVSSFLPIEVYVYLCGVYWANRGLRCRFCFEDMPFMLTRVIEQPFVEDAWTPVVSLITPEEEKVLSMSGKPSVPTNVDDPAVIFSDPALFPVGSTAFPFDPGCIPATFAFDAAELKSAVGRVDDLSVGFRSLFGSKMVSSPKDLSYLDKFFTDV